MDEEELKALTSTLWECLSRLRNGSGSKADKDCCERSYHRLRDMFDEYYTARGIGELEDIDVWFTRRVLEAYRELRTTLNP